MKWTIPLIAFLLLLLAACDRPAQTTEENNLKTLTLNLITNAFECFPFYHLHI
jgi:hypothetical protein